MSDGEMAILGKLADVAERQAVTTERLTSLIERVDEHLTRMDGERDDAVASVKQFVGTSLANHDSWWRRFAIIMGAITAAAAALGSGLMRLIPFGTNQPK